MYHRENYSSFREMCVKYFPKTTPNIDVCRQSERKEPGWEIVESVRNIEWQNLEYTDLEKIGAEMHWISESWMKYLLPAYMCLTLENYSKRKYLDDELEFAYDAEYYLIKFRNLVDGDFNNIDMTVWTNLTEWQSRLVLIWLMIVNTLSDQNYVQSEGLEKLHSILSKN